MMGRSKEGCLDYLVFTVCCGIYRILNLTLPLPVMLPSCPSTVTRIATSTSSHVTTPYMMCIYHIFLFSVIDSLSPLPQMITAG